MLHIADGHKHHSNHQVVERDYFQVKINDADDNGDGQHVYAASQRAVNCQTKATTDLDGFVQCMRMGQLKGQGRGEEGLFRGDE